MGRNEDTPSQHGNSVGNQEAFPGRCLVAHGAPWAAPTLQVLTHPPHSVMLIPLEIQLIFQAKPEHLDLFPQEFAPEACRGTACPGQSSAWSWALLPEQYL